MKLLNGHATQLKALQVLAKRKAESRTALLIALLKILPHLLSRRKINEIRSNGDFSAHAQEGHHTLIITPPSCNFLLIFLVMRWIIIQVRGHTIRPELHTSRGSPLTVILAIEFYIQRQKTDITKWI
ncbi:Os02g0522100 [Oryza sativa Japonica Group]|uniref:Os02g0522100 protein n=1 Tax=Oryza sativa subsp. japonica TaxID=39947 RepID=Q6H556_ORYSJ|nr:unknown protein [Oryza sativa Japonica Group]BAF08894.1 Os02g0522100 [Oryza sativa Japonica Group]|eukprot:NP_001046980.1 Os02g0522100 [Oryza sativa Japonica Group]